MGRSRARHVLSEFLGGLGAAHERLRQNARAARADPDGSGVTAATGELAGPSVLVAEVPEQAPHLPGSVQGVRAASEMVMGRVMTAPALEKVRSPAWAAALKKGTSCARSTTSSGKFPQLPRGA